MSIWEFRQMVEQAVPMWALIWLIGVALVIYGLVSVAKRGPGA